MKMNIPSCSYFLRVACVCAAGTSIVFSLASCRVKQTQEAKAPEVEVKEGQMPKYDVDPAKVTVEPEKKEITVPKVTTEEKTITVPDVDVTMPDEQEDAEGEATPAPAATP